MNMLNIAMLLLLSTTVRSGNMVYTGEMPWIETNQDEQRGNFAVAFQTRQWSMTEFCERYA